MEKSESKKGKKGDSDSFEIKVSKKNFDKDFGKVYFHSGGRGGAIYGLGFVGALIYFISTSTSFWQGFVGIFKAIVWPAFVVYGLLGFLGL